ncbi:MAG TPA: hypothetical protein VNH13_08970 [Candidatus Acidoferrales bacterium]|nr:hypothetical protein [Candidatus Acidoferrales bacterium]
MTILLAAAALVAAAGAIAALAPGDARLGLVGLAATLIGAALLADPLPSPAVLAVRLAGAMLAIALVRAGVPATGDRPADSAHHAGSRLGWVAEALLGLSGAVAGLAIAAGITTFTPVGGAPVLPSTTSSLPFLTEAGLAVGLAGLMAAIALGPTLLDRAGLRRTVATVVTVQGVILLRLGLAGRPSALEEVALAALLVAVAATAALLSRAAQPGPDARAEAAGSRS